MSHQELKVYRDDFTAIAFPGAARIFLVVLDGLRLTGLMWAALCAINGLWWRAAVLAAFFFMVGALVVKLHPAPYPGWPSRKGNPVATGQLLLIDSVQRKRALYNFGP